MLYVTWRVEQVSINFWLSHGKLADAVFIERPTWTQSKELQPALTIPKMRQIMPWIQNSSPDHHTTYLNVMFCIAVFAAAMLHFGKLYLCLHE